MNDLIDHHMLNRASPDTFLELAAKGASYTTFAQDFLNFLESRPQPLLPYEYVQVHTEKLPYLLFQELSSKGLVYHFDGTAWQESWWFVEKSTAHLYMSYLAAVISKMSPGTVPVTDRRQGFGKALIGEIPQDNSPTTPEYARLRFSMIANALPAPRTQVPASELRRFKDDNHDILRRCRNEIDLEILRLAGITEPNEKAYAISILTERIQDDIETLQGEMSRRRWPKIVLVGVGGLVVVGHEVLVTGALMR
ncbi:hypothetical protein GCM10025781_27330 [Kocuria gwangalliensis]|uniref:Uncharacterized protein n=1 Tax=Kocuria gwangalliensis TaxID=501592 RepID=A0ABP8XFQ3_9MICC